MAHLRHSVPERSHSSYTLVEGQHLQLAIRQYSQEIETPMGPENMDALFSACLLMTVNSFPLEKYNPRQSFVFSENPAPSLNWLFVQSGLSHLLCRAQPWLPRSMWLETFLSSSRENRDFYQDKRPGRDRLPSALADICGITEHTTEETNPYLWPLRMLTPLLSVEPSLATFSQFTTFMGRLLPEFHDRLIQKDPPALILLAWWLALMYSIDLWWVKTRARSECAAICMYLENSRDPLVLKLLEFPAQRCGILLPSACSA
ncbi:hypothetical protein ARAM_006958 [Aspergillus rambellii]|uniref:C6 transcription factor n=1 Tax=Aspergillus rambellii TaxID=308745 RepID=A0A0F8WF84_9EURO|nr:hypothetical protein ARAM_006958 [Aspergillus rambellii]